MALSKNEDMSAPASEMPEHSQSGNNTSVLTKKQQDEYAFVDKYSATDVYINADKDTSWFPWTANMELKPLRFDTKSGTFVMAMRSLGDGQLGKHRHRGSVSAVTIAGQWGYKEYDWTAGPGDYVLENPGTTHTLWMKSGTEGVFTVSGSLEFVNDNGSLEETMDIFSFAKLYYDHCEKQGVRPNDGLWY